MPTLRALLGLPDEKTPQFPSGSTAPGARRTSPGQFIIFAWN
jgi:hypothetical protein